MKCYVEYNNITEEMGLGDSSAPIATPLEKVTSNCKRTCMALSSGFSYSFPKWFLYLWIQPLQAVPLS